MAIAMTLIDWHQGVEEEEPDMPEDPVPAMIEALRDAWPALPEADHDVVRLGEGFALTAGIVGWAEHPEDAGRFERIVQGCLGADWQRYEEAGEH